MRRFLVATGLAVGLGAAGAAQAVSYDLAADFGASVFSYGTGSGATGFAAFTVPHTNCFGGANFVCANNDPTPSFVPTVGANVGSSDYVFNNPAITVPANAVFLHPGDGAGTTDAVLRFTAAVSGAYTLSGAFARIDSTNQGSGTIASIYNGQTSIFSTVLAPLAGYPAGTPFSLAVSLNAGDVLSFVVNNNVGYNYDSTALTGTISSAVPEPASWAMMVGGFGLLGAAMRRRKVTVRFA